MVNFQLRPTQLVFGSVDELLIQAVEMVRGSPFLENADYHSDFP